MALLPLPAPPSNSSVLANANAFEYNTQKRDTKFCVKSERVPSSTIRKATQLICSLPVFAAVVKTKMAAIYVTAFLRINLPVRRASATTSPTLLLSV
jgi:hypothetical protein